MQKFFFDMKDGVPHRDTVGIEFKTALLNRERMSRKDAGHAQLIGIFVRHRAEIEHLALAKLQREGHSDRGVVVTTEDLNP